MSGDDRKGGPRKSAGVGNVPLRDPGGPTGAELGTTGGGGAGEPGNVLGDSGGVGSRTPSRDHDAEAQPEGLGDRSPG